MTRTLREAQLELDNLHLRRELAKLREERGLVEMPLGCAVQDTFTRAQVGISYDMKHDMYMTQTLKLGGSLLFQTRDRGMHCFVEWSDKKMGRGHCSYWVGEEMLLDRNHIPTIMSMKHEEVCIGMAHLMRESLDEKNRR